MDSCRATDFRNLRDRLTWMFSRGVPDASHNFTGAGEVFLLSFVTFKLAARMFFLFALPDSVCQYNCALTRFTGAPGETRALLMPRQFYLETGLHRICTVG